MKYSISAIAAAATTALMLAAPLAQAQGTPGSAKGGDSMAASAPKGEMSTPNQDKGSARMKPSTESRAAVKADAAAANKAGNIVEGEKSTKNQDKGGAPKTGMNSRADVKQDAAAANKAGTIPEGEKSTKDQDKGGIKGAKP